ncbi:hypothetical protein [Vibrio sp. CB1-14]|uniref:Helicase/UvrB N-terminal domain-containing protein n=1 Tax=Vibrio chaetopteri TaxID=3016528 RepID=A0AAU8BP58_9VIBR
MLSLQSKSIRLQQGTFCQVTLGGGKTAMAAELTKCLIREDKIDLVLCFSPSFIVALGIKEMGGSPSPITTKPH